MTDNNDIHPKYFLLMSTFVEVLTCGGPWARAQCA